MLIFKEYIVITMAGEFVDDTFMEVSLLKKFSKDEGINDAETVPELSDKERLVLFKNNGGMLEYYRGLRECIDKLRLEGDLDCLCDPRDVKMCDKIKQSSWRPEVTMVGIDDIKDGSEPGHILSTKQTALDEVNHQQADDFQEDKELKIDDQLQKENFVCGVHGCNEVFRSLRSHESHYHTNHNFVCHVCKRILLSNFLLEVHLEENHDSYFQVLCLRIDMYRCLVESCPLKFRTAELRKDHLVNVHKYPSSFSFHKPIKHNKSQTGKRGKITGGECTPEQRNYSDNSTEMDVDVRQPVGQKRDGNQQEKRVGKPNQRGRGRGKNRVLSTVCFGRGSQRAFQPRGRSGHRGRHWYQTQSMDLDTTVDIEKIDFTDMSESLVN